MNVKLLVIFIVLNALNVVIQTVKSLLTVKGGKWVAAITNAIAYGLYTVVVIYMVCDLPLWIKALIIGGCNLLGVYFVKAFEEKLKKDKLWKIECTVKNENFQEFANLLNSAQISFNMIKCTNNIDTIFNIYSKTQSESNAIKEISKRFNAKYFVTESKTL